MEAFATLFGSDETLLRAERELVDREERERERERERVRVDLLGVSF